MNDESTHGDEESRFHEETISDTVGVSDGADQQLLALLAWEESNRGRLTSVQKSRIRWELRRLAAKGAVPGSESHTTDAVISTTEVHEQTVVDLKKLNRIKATLNVLGEDFRKARYDDLKDDGLVYVIADPKSDMDPDVQRGASAELDRRHAAAMRQSASWAHWAAFWVYTLGWVQVVFVAERLMTG